MAENTLTVQEVTPAGLVMTFAAANTDGSKFACPTDQRTCLRVKNSNGSTRTVTLVAQKTTQNLPGSGVTPIPDKVVTIPANTGDMEIGPIPTDYVDSSGFAHVTFSATAGLTVGAFHMARRG